MRTKIYFDGGCRPNPGTMEIAVVLRGQAHVRRAMGQGTSQQAEWLALIEAARLARQHGLTDFVLLGDALAVIGQAAGKVRCSGAALAHRAMLEALLPPGNRLRIRHIGRAQNLAGIALARLHPR